MGYPDPHPPPSVFSQGGSLLPSTHADARCIDDGIAIEMLTRVVLMTARYT